MTPSTMTFLVHSSIFLYFCFLAPSFPVSMYPELYTSFFFELPSSWCLMDGSYQLSWHNLVQICFFSSDYFSVHTLLYLCCLSCSFVANKPPHKRTLTPLSSSIFLSDLPHCSSKDFRKVFYDFKDTLPQYCCSGYFRVLRFLFIFKWFFSRCSPGANKSISVITCTYNIHFQFCFMYC